MELVRSDILVIGSGAAGLFFALKASEYADVRVITKKKADQSNTRYAQGGIASVMDRVRDSFDLHIKDTIEAGRGLCDREAVEIMVREGPDRIEELIALGVRFSRDDSSGSLRLGREGGHTQPRIVHYGDLTGRELEETLLKACASNPRIEIEEERLAVDLVVDGMGRVRGCHALLGGGEICTYLASNTVLATGGAGKIYLYTSNPDVATGDGIAMAYAAGAEIENLEFVQFHPTCLYHSEAKSHLISEALRGEGAVLRSLDGREFMNKYDPRAELAPRDIVARAIDSEMKQSGEKYVLLDISHKSGAWLRERFPFVYETCLEFGIDIGSEPIPVVPAAHYMVGGVKARIDGTTALKGLYAIGEVACSGCHGANRLASNSLLESLVSAARCAARLAGEIEKDHYEPSVGEVPVAADPKVLETVILDHDWDLTRRVMWDYVGIVRSDERLHIARQRIGQIAQTVRMLFDEYGISSDMVELRNIALVSSLVVESASMRKESRGLHYNMDWPEMDPSGERSTLMRRGAGRGPATTYGHKEGTAD
ncbi:MAG: L-aspartate oxidase [Candidatus Krumholzibacteria bacterium]|nr:L-aspartate oxidase [Candidatus Krumholzibacteria bacterium]